MHMMFYGSQFNGYISKWDVSKVTDMSWMFCESDFNHDISIWDVYNVKDMSWMFFGVKFNQNISTWKPYSLENLDNIFLISYINKPYWAKFKDREKRRKAINSFHLSNTLNDSLKVDKPIKRLIKV